MVIHNDPVFYAVIPSSELESVDYTQTMCTREGVRVSIDGSKAIVKWKGADTPSSVSAISEMQGPYNRQEILSVVSAEEWAGTLPNYETEP
jgi:hypothetical protein